VIGSKIVEVLTTNDPTWADKVSAVASAVGAVGIIVAAVGAWLAFNQIKETRRDRDIQVLSDFGRRWDEERLTEARTKLLSYTSSDLAAEVEKWFTPPREPTSEVPILLRVPSFFEDLAIMVECGRLELKFVSKSFRGIAIREWEYWSDAIDKMRQYEPSSYVEFEKMVRQLLEEQP
jgi:hypothetical protein